MEDELGEEPQTTSPIVKEITTMDFGTCLRNLVNGGKYRRLGWENPKVFITLYNSQVMIFKPEDNRLHPLLVSEGDILSKDWFKIEEQMS